MIDNIETTQNFKLETGCSFYSNQDLREFLKHIIGFGFSFDATVKPGSGIVIDAKKNCGKSQGSILN